MASITVNATGTAPVTEHRAEVHLRLEAGADLPGEALAALTAKVERLRGLLAERGLPDDAVATEHLDVQPRWDPAGGQPNGALAATAVRITVGSPAEVGALLDHLLGGLGAGATVQHVGQVPVVPADVEAAARRAAVEAARERAAQLAEAAGGALGGLLSLLEGGAPGWSPFPGPARPLAAASEVHVWERRSEATVTVTAVYELVDAADR